MATISSNGKVGYLYDQETDTWHPLAGTANTAANYEWSGTHDFLSTASFTSAAIFGAGFNNFQNPEARDIALPNPSNGTVCFVRQDANGNIINKIQFYSTVSSSWLNYDDESFIDISGNHTLALHNSGKTLWTSSLTDITISVPANTFPVGATIAIVRGDSGEVTIAPVPASGVTIRSKLSNDRISTPYAGAQLTHKGANEWILIGDLKD